MEETAARPERDVTYCEGSLKWLSLTGAGTVICDHCGCTITLAAVKPKIASGQANPHYRYTGETNTPARA